MTWNRALHIPLIHYTIADNGTMSDSKILLVDDNKATIRLIQVLLKKIGFTNITSAQNGVEGLAEMNKELYNIILSDWSMPEMDGLKFLKTIRNIDRFKQIPFIMFTAKNEGGNVIEAIKAGATDYIVKPMTIEILSEKLKFHL